MKKEHALFLLFLQRETKDYKMLNDLHEVMPLESTQK